MAFILSDWQEWKRTGDPKLMTKLLQDNYGLVKTFVRKMVNYDLFKGDMEDLEQEAYIGLINAVKRFDPEKGTFATYAYWAVKDKVMAALPYQIGVYKPKTKNMPKGMLQKMDMFYTKHGRQATHEDLGVKESVFEEWKTFKFHFTTDNPDPSVFESDYANYRLWPKDIFIDSQPLQDDKFLYEELMLKIAVLRPCLTDFEYETLCSGKTEGVRPHILGMLKEELDA